MANIRTIVFVLFVLFVTAGSTASADELSVVRDYANALITHARDTYGRQRSPLFATTLDRETMALIEAEAAPFVYGLEERDRMVGGSNPMHDQNLYQILYALTTLTGETRYAEEADAALGWFLRHCQSEETALFPWGAHMGWDFKHERRIWKLGGTLHAFFRPWVLWPAGFALEPRASFRFAKGLWEHQIGDPETGNFARRAYYDTHGPGVNRDDPRHAGFYIATWGQALLELRDDRYLSDLSLGTWSLALENRRSRWLESAVSKLVGYMSRRRIAESGAIAEVSGIPTSTEPWNGRLVRPVGTLSLAVDLYDAAKQVPDDLVAEMRELAAHIDSSFLGLRHDPGGRGFATGVDVYTLQPYGPESAILSTGWFADGLRRTHAEVANICAMRYSQTKNDAFRSLVLQTAQGYLKQEPRLSDPGDPGVWRYIERVIGGETPIYPVAMGQAIKLMLNAYALSGDRRYLSRAEHFGKVSVETFVGDAKLPRATHRNDHYEAATGGDALMMALLELWAVREGRIAEVSLVWCDR
jgi:hypothetical protein